MLKTYPAKLIERRFEKNPDLLPDNLLLLSGEKTNTLKERVQERPSTKHVILKGGNTEKHSLIQDTIRSLPTLDKITFYMTRGLSSKNIIELATGIPNLSEITFYHCDGYLGEALKKFKNLNKINLYFGHMKLDDINPWLENLKNIENLNSLMIHNCHGLKPENLKHLGSLTKLDELILQEHDDDFDETKELFDLSFLSQLKTLKIINFPQIQGGLEQLANFDQLESLSFYGCVNLADTLSPIQNLTKLKFLDVSRTDIPSKILQEVLLKNTELKSLALNGCKLHREVLSNISLLSLKEIDLEGVWMSDENFKKLFEKSYNIEYLNLSKTKELTNICTETIRNWHHLKTLILHRKAFPGGMSNLTQLPNLELLDFGKTDFISNENYTSEEDFKAIKNTTAKHIKLDLLSIPLTINLEDLASSLKEKLDEHVFQKIVDQDGMVTEKITYTHDPSISDERSYKA